MGRIRNISRLRAGGARIYTGPVANSTYFPTGAYSVGGSVGYNSWTAHWATQDITSLQLVFVSARADNAVGGVVTEHTTSLTNNFVTCVIEYPAGVYTRVKQSGSNTITLNIGGVVVTDSATVSIPKGSKFVVATYWTNQAGGVPVVAGTYDIGTNRITNEVSPNDRTGAFSVLPEATNWTVAGWQLGPQAIIAQTSNRTFALIGDSRTEGVQDGKTDANKGNTGEIARAVYNAGYGMLNLGIGNDRASKYILSHTLRLQLAQYCSDVVLGFGANDIFFDTAATLLSNTQTIMGYFPGKRIYLYTLPPVGVTSTDNYATLANQTVNGVNTVLAGYNTLLRAGVSGTIRTWEVGDVLASARDSGKWRVDLGLVNGMTSAGDPTHENALGNTTISTSGAITF